jgi:hypothetical protein
MNIKRKVYSKNKVISVPKHHAMKLYRACGGAAQRTSNFCTRSKMVINEEVNGKAPVPSQKIAGILNYTRREANWGSLSV